MMSIKYVVFNAEFIYFKSQKSNEQINMVLRSSVVTKIIKYPAHI